MGDVRTMQLPGRRSYLYECRLDLSMDVQSQQERSDEMASRAPLRLLEQESSLHTLFRSGRVAAKALALDW
jgi:hypothetical protein